MAQRRMFSPKVVGSDAFLEMPTSSRELYFQLGMYADDDGFVNPKRVIRMIGASEDDLKILLTKRFVLAFQNGVIVIKHWRINNLIRKDWYQETVYLEEKKQIVLKDNNSYTELNKQLVNEFVNSSSTEVSLVKLNNKQANNSFKKEKQMGGFVDVDWKEEFNQEHHMHKGMRVVRGRDNKLWCIPLTGGKWIAYRQKT